MRKGAFGKKRKVLTAPEAVPSGREKTTSRGDFVGKSRKIERKKGESVSGCNILF